MSYVKLFKACEDYALGIASANNASGNLEALLSSWSAEHGYTQPAAGLLLFQNPFAAFGTHTTPPIPRAMVRAKPTSSGGATVSLTFNDMGAVVRSVKKTATGTWDIELDGNLTLYFGDPKAVQSDNTVTRLCQPYNATVFGGGNGLIVKTYELSAGDFVLTDFEFTCAIYSYV